MKLKLRAQKTLEKNKPKAKLTCFSSKKSIFWRQKIALEKALDMKIKKWVKLEVGEGLIMDLCKNMTYRYP